MEEIIGIWIDNKPLYSSIISVTLSTGATGAGYVFTDTSISGLNISTIVDIRGTVITTNGNVYNVNCYHKSDKFSIGAFLINTDGNQLLRVRHLQSTVDGAKAYIKLVYTKKD